MGTYAGRPRAAGTTIVWDGTKYVEAGSVTARAKARASGNLSLTGVPAAQDGVTISATDTLLLTGQTTASENGMWVVSAGAWSRSGAMPTGSNAAGIQTFVSQGTVAGGTIWLCTSQDGSAVVGTNNLTFTQMGTGGGGDITVQENGSTVGVRATLNFEGGNFTVTDDSGNDRVNISVSAGAQNVFTTLATSTSVTIDEADAIVAVAGISGPVTITLPASPADGEVHWIKDVDGAAGANNITISGNGSNIDSASTFVMNTNYTSITVCWTGSKWSII